MIEGAEQENTKELMGAPYAVSLWLFVCAGLVFAMVVVGAITRLTDSGLSMVEWRPIMGFLPPMDAVEWNRVFDLYKASPEYQKKHFWMDLSDFKAIFFWEWAHRFLGRVIGLAYGLPLLWFFLRGSIPKPYILPLLGLLVLGGMQGLMGWYMVQSGLVDVPAVSHYRLAAHLSLAFLIFSLLIWFGLSIGAVQTKVKKVACAGFSMLSHSILVLGLLILTIFWGAYTAGLDAGLVYNESFPKMGGAWIPPTLHQYSPFWINFFENPVGVQFVHRWLAMITVLSVLSFWVRGVMNGDRHWSLHALAIMVLIQMILGITTLLSGVYIPLAVMHQAGALILLGLLVVNMLRVRMYSHST